MQQLLSLFLLLLCSLCAYADDLTLKLIGEAIIPTNSRFEDIEVGGLSGIDLAPNGELIAISDTRGDKHGHPRFYEIHLDYDQHAVYDATILKQTLLRQADNTPYPAHNPIVDPESIRFAPNGHLYWVSEGNDSNNPALRHQPSINEMMVNGDFVRSFQHPPMLNYTSNDAFGGRSNKTFESLAINTDGLVFVGCEEALKQDSALASRLTGSSVRITAFNPINGQPIHQYAYSLPKIPNASKFSFFQINGLSDLLTIGNQQFLALERAYVAGIGNTIHIVETAVLPETTDVLGIDSLHDVSFTPMQRKVILTLPPKFQGIRIDNIEGMSWGKTLENGHRSLILVSDNNFSSHQVTQFLVFEVLE